MPAQVQQLIGICDCKAFVTWQRHTLDHTCSRQVFLMIDDNICRRFACLGALNDFLKKIFINVLQIEITIYPLVFTQSHIYILKSSGFEYVVVP